MLITDVVLNNNFPLEKQNELFLSVFVRSKKSVFQERTFVEISPQQYPSLRAAFVGVYVVCTPICEM